MILYIIVSVIIVILLVAFVTNKKYCEMFTIGHDTAFFNKLKSVNEKKRSNNLKKNKEIYSENQKLRIDRIQKEVNKMDEFLKNIQNSLNNQNIPICREIDLNHKIVESNDPCKDKHLNDCELNSFCVIDKNTSTGDKFCRKKELNPACKDILQEYTETLPDGSEVKKKKITKLFLYPKVMQEIRNLKIV